MQFSSRTHWKLNRNSLTEALDAAKGQGRRVIDLTVSNPTRVGLHYGKRIILEALASPQSLDYDPQPKGLRQAREAVAGYYREQHAVEIDDGNLVLTTSTSEGYSFVFRLLCNPGDEVLVPKPSYPLFEFLADLHDVRLVSYSLLYDHGWQIDFHSMRDALSKRTRAVVVVNPNNPTGSFIHAQEVRELNGICAEYQLAIIADEVFLDYAHDGERRASFAANDEALTFTLSGVSKISALPQMKVAWIGVSGSVRGTEAALARLEVIADTYLSMNAPIQWATAALLGQRKEMQNQLRERVRANLGELDRQLAAQRAGQRLLVEGGWYAILRIPVTQADEELAVALLRQKNVLIHPGHFYDFPREGYLVLSLITRPEEFARGIEGLLEQVNQ